MDPSAAAKKRKVKKSADVAAVEEVEEVPDTTNKTTAAHVLDACTDAQTGKTVNGFRIVPSGQVWVSLMLGLRAWSQQEVSRLLEGPNSAEFFKATFSKEDAWVWEKEWPIAAMTSVKPMVIDTSRLTIIERADPCKSSDSIVPSMIKGARLFPDIEKVCLEIITCCSASEDEDVFPHARFSTLASDIWLAAPPSFIFLHAVIYKYVLGLDVGGSPRDPHAAWMGYRNIVGEDIQHPPPPR